MFGAIGTVAGILAVIEYSREFDRIWELIKGSKNGNDELPEGDKETEPAESAV